MRLVCIADLQGLCDQVDISQLPDGDILICAGDFTSYGSVTELGMFDNWMWTLRNKYRYSVVVGGNHELGLAKYINGHKFFKNFTYLEDELVEIEGLKIYGTPANSCGIYAHNWAFCETSYIKRAFDNIPDGINILISHGPPYKILDTTPSGTHIGDRTLLRAVQRTKPIVHVFGHTHSAYGTVSHGTTRFVNAALCNEENTIVDNNGLLIRNAITLDI